MEENRNAAIIGRMRSAYKAKHYEDAVSDAGRVRKISGIPAPLSREADYLTAKSYLALSRRSDAMEYFGRLSSQPSTPEGAEASYMLVQNLFDSKCVGVELADSLIDGVARTCLLDPDMQKWFSENNRFALEESQRRLLELNTRGKWNADPDVLKKLQSAYLMAEGDLEEGLSGAGDVQAGSVEIVTDSKVGSWAERLGATDDLLKEKGRS